LNEFVNYLGELRKSEKSQELERGQKKLEKTRGDDKGRR
jgi:hypothetical protein